MTKINENNIIRFLSGQADEKEAREILQWKNGSEENRKKFREIEIACNASEIIMNPENFDSSAALLKIRSKLQRNKTFYLKKFIGYAATAVIAIGLTWFAQRYFLAEEEAIATAETGSQSVETPSGAKTLVTLEDGTKIWLNANSKLDYPAHFSTDKRIVRLEGEGFFEIAKEKDRPFEVFTSDLKIKVLGTVFNLKSYPEDGLIETTLIEGKVALNKMTEGEQDHELYQLEANQQAMFVKKEGFLTKDEMVTAGITFDESAIRMHEKLFINEHIDTEAITAWKDGKMIFKNETFESIAIKLERRYNSKITFRDEAVKYYRFSGKFDEISIEQALKALQFASAFNYSINQQNIIIRR